MAQSQLISERSGCPIASTLDSLGDKWSLVIVRDMLNGKTRFGDFLDSPEGIPTNILTSRLKRMVEMGLVTRRPYQDRPVRHEYILTATGEALLPVLQEICRWANKFIPDTWVPPAQFMARKVSRSRRS